MNHPVSEHRDGQRVHPGDEVVVPFLVDGVLRHRRAVVTSIQTNPAWGEVHERATIEPVLHSGERVIEAHGRPIAIVTIVG